MPVNCKPFVLYRCLSRLVATRSQVEAVPAEVEGLRSASTTPVNKVEHPKCSQNDML